MTYDRLYMTRTKKPSLKSLILLSDERPDDLPKLVTLRKRLERNYQLEVNPLRDNLFSIHIRKKVWGKPVSGKAIIDYDTKGCWIVYTDETGYFVKRVLEPFLNGLYPDISRVHFNYLQIQRFLEAIKETHKGSSVVTYVAYKRQSRMGREQPKGTRLLWEPGAEEDLKRDAGRYRIWIDSLTFQVQDQAGMVTLEASLTGRGLARLRLGRFTDFYHNVIQLYIGLATRWKNFFSGRERRIEEGKVKLRPYLLQYQSDIEKSQIEELVANLSGSYSHSILFGGNPYFAANLTDYQDGSSFYLTILGGKVTITPMLKSTPYALWRMASRIQRVVGEGEILDISRGHEAW